MAKSDDRRRSVCPVACTLDLIGDRWTLLLIRDMACGKRFFGEFRRAPERIASNILADRLGKLVSAGLAEKVPVDSSGRDSYRLTARGKSLQPVLFALAAWGLSHIEGTAAHLTPSFE